MTEKLPPAFDLFLPIRSQRMALIWYIFVLSFDFNSWDLAYCGVW